MSSDNDEECPPISVVAHRGASADFPEHSLEAYIEAIDVGADGLECDVRLTADGHLVCLHDPTVDRTSNGRGRVAGLTLSQLRRLDWGSEIPGPLTLKELFELVRDCGRRVELAVETKHPTRYGGATEEALCDLMDWFGWLPAPGEPQAASTSGDASGTPVRVMSFSAPALRRVHRRSRGVPLVWLLEKPNTAATRVALPGAAAACGPGIELVRDEPQWVEAIRAAGHRLHVWTVDRPEDVQAALNAGAGHLITNRPASVLRQLGRLAPTES